jgi:uncharacterized protein YqcC (DUF446 family)
LQLPLPQDCAVSPMAEEVYTDDSRAAQRLVSILAAIDTLLSAGTHSNH